MKPTEVIVYNLFKVIRVPIQTWGVETLAQFSVQSWNFIWLQINSGTVHGMDSPLLCKKILQNKKRKVICLNQSHNKEPGLGNLKQVLNATLYPKELG